MSDEEQNLPDEQIKTDKRTHVISEFYQYLNSIVFKNNFSNSFASILQKWMDLAFKRFHVALYLFIK